MATIAADNFNRTGSGGWGAAQTGGTWAPTNGTYFSTNGSRGVVTSNAGSTAVARLPISATTADLAVSLGLNKLVAGGSLYGYVHSRSISESAGATTSYGAFVTIDSSGAVLLYSRINGTGANRVSTGLTVTAADRLNLRVKTSGTSPTRLQAKTWKAGTAEPAAWAIDITDSTSGLQTAGGIALGNFTSSAATNAPITVTWDDLTVSDGVTANVLPNVSAGADQTVNSGATVTLTGTASDPDGTIASRAWTNSPSGSGPALTPSGTNPNVATFTAPSTPGQYVFQFSATDNGGGTSSDSTTVTVKTPTTPPTPNVTQSPGLVAIDATSSTGSNPLTYSCSPAPFAEPTDGYFLIQQTFDAQAFLITVTDTVTGATAPANVTVPAMAIVGNYDGAPIELDLPIPLDPSTKDTWGIKLDAALEKLRDTTNDLINHYNGEQSGGGAVVGSSTIA